MTNDEIVALKARVAEGGVMWRDADGICHPVAAVNLEWVEFEDEPGITEPAALLADGGAVALLNVSVSTFITTTQAIHELGRKVPESPEHTVEKGLWINVRGYSVAEIDNLRAACELKWMFGTSLPVGNCVGRSYRDEVKAVCVEEMVRTYMLAGIRADDIYANDTAANGGAVT